ncbi:MAG: LLM class F420-dependent oxidoreductase [Rhodospirillaceae bacterium]|jgi:probable F420-dependent oxidoreductase|nr:LLM class F420-dependent oxidoreductase [Rhodospirillaceae bacterium]MBT6306490.1 LLM class F420-dependent oxidoreductase [Rhodospirillaceae bacterium]MDC0998559.1 LLM class F420-dependent oxidoreductase [Alphaproteobacteria bacterium]MDC1441715.1 LLM class F420-dependent oxidoreductase [Rhodospirillaceae bacterium]
MKLGLSFPQTEIGTDPVKIKDFIQTAEGLGYDFITFVDHVLGEEAPRGASFAGNYTRDYMFHEVMVLMGYAAAVTKTIGLGTAVMILPQRQAVLVAKQAAEVDLLSGGRMRLGVGLGWNRVEYDALGMPFKNRAKRFSEQIEVMRELWSNRVIEYKGEFHSFDSAGINPEPIQRPIPVWIGAMKDVAVRRAARIGDGWFMYPRQEPSDDAHEMISIYRQAAAEAGREPDSLGINATVFANQGLGPDEWRSIMEKWKEMGVNEFTFRTAESDLKNLKAHMNAIKEMAEVR